MSHRIIASVASCISVLCKESCKRLHFLLAVSGGSDSIALLHIIYSLKKRLDFDLSVVTVNHNIREEKVSREDAQFVFSMCSESFAEKIPCIIAEISAKDMQETVKRRGKGIEEAARFLRRRAYERARKIFGATHVLTAHTKDDFFEGVIMSFFSGASSTSLLGMKVKNGHYVKPLLSLEKSDLQQYLLKNNIKWREDATNSSLQYLRNKVRLSLIPYINKVFPGWRSGLQKTLNRLAIDEEYVLSSYQFYLKTIDYWKRCDCGLCINAVQFLSMPKSFALRLLQEGCVLLGIQERVSYDAMLSLLDLSLTHCKVRAGGLLLYIKEDKVVFTVHKKESQKTLFEKSKVENSLSHKSEISETEENNEEKHGYLFWIDKRDCDFSIAKHSLKVRLINEKEAIIFFDGVESMRLSLPFCIRTRMLGDFITINGKQRTLKSIFSKMGISSKMSTLLPIVEVGGEVKAVYASIVGKKNLIGEIENK